MTAPPAKLTVLRSLGFAATCAIVVCNMVGQGVFLKARVMTCNVGSPAIMIAAWIAAGVLAFCGALTLAELGAALPESGGIYAFLRRAYGDAIGFSYGWETLFVGGPASTAALAAGTAIFFNLAAGHVLEGVTLAVRMPFLGATWPLTGLQLFAVFMIVAIVAVNLAPALVNGQIASGFALLKIGMLVAITFAAFALGNGTFAHYAQSGARGACTGVSAATRAGVPGFAAALIGALYAYQGWQSSSLIAGEVKDPGRVFPRSLAVSVGVVMACYVVANISYVYVLGPVAIASLPPGASVGVSVVATIFGPVWRSIAAALLFVSVAATLHVTVLTAARVPYALASDGLGFGPLARLSAHARVPVNALLANGAISIVLVLVGSFDALSDYLVFNAWVYFAATAAAVFVLRRREPKLLRPFRTPGYPLVPAIFVAISLWLLVQTLISNPRNSLIGLAIVAFGFPYYYWRRTRMKPVDERAASV
jgi:APA family basic amino acid/polyamine antiporter